MTNGPQPEQPVAQFTVELDRRMEEQVAIWKAHHGHSGSERKRQFSSGYGQIFKWPVNDAYVRRNGEAELTKLISAARKGRYGHRDATLILIMARHGLRVSEAIDLEWDQIDFTRAHLHVRRLKGGIASVHPIQGDELRAFRELRRQTEGAFVFGSERGGPMTRFNVSKMIESAGERAGLPFAHPHMLRHTCGHLLADAGHDTRRLQLWLGHADIKHTAHYSELSAKPFKEFWKT